MLLELGRYTFDISTRALVMATVPNRENALTVAEDLVGLGAHILEVSGDSPAVTDTVVALTQAFDVPISIASSDASQITACFEAGASIAHDPTGFGDPMYLQAVADATGSVATSYSPANQEIGPVVERARWAQAAGIATSRIILRASPNHVADLAPFGWPVMVHAAHDDGVQGGHVAAMMAGVRILVSNDVRATRRTTDTVSELLERRGVAAPDGIAIGSR